MFFLGESVQISVGGMAMAASVATIGYALIRFGDRLWKREEAAEQPAPPAHRIDLEMMREMFTPVIESQKALNEAQQRTAESITQMVMGLTVNYEVQKMRHDEVTRELREANERLTRSPGGVVRT